MILIIGIPNSGKTTYSENFEKVIHYDNFKLTTLDRHIQILTLIKNNDNICIEGVYEDSNILVRLSLSSVCSIPS